MQDDTLEFLNIAITQCPAIYIKPVITNSKIKMKNRIKR